MALTKDFGFGPDERLVRDQARKFLRDSFPVDKLRTLVAKDHHEAYESPVQPAPWDRDLWKQMVELGWKGLAVPESAGGLGMKTIVAATLVEELARAGVPSPLEATLLASMVLRAAGAEARGNSAGPARAWLHRRAEHRHRVPICRGKSRTVP